MLLRSVQGDPSLLPGNNVDWGSRSASSRAPPANTDELALEVKAYSWKLALFLFTTLSCFEDLEGPIPDIFLPFNL